MSLALAALVAAVLTGIAWRTNSGRRRAPALPAAAVRAPARLAVLLPVRDEEDEVEACLATLLGQTARPRVVVVDDGSTDSTAARVAALAEATPRLETIQAGPLPAGWRGKLHALQRGLDHLGPAFVDDPDAWVLTTDADTRHHPEAFARALAAARARGLDLVSLAGRQRAEGIAENLLTPPAFALLDAVLGDWPAAAAAPVGPGAEPVANGQFMLFRAQALAAGGGFAAVRNVPLDDVALAATLAQAGSRCGFLRALDLLEVRMYRGLGETVRGWRRNLGVLVGARPLRLAAALTVLVAPPALLAGLAIAVALGAGPAAPLAILWAGGAAASMALRAGSRHAPAWGLLYPLDALALATLLAVAAVDWRRGRLTSWKGREMKVEPSPSGRPPPGT